MSMEALPSEYQNIELTRSEKIFIRYILSQEEYGFIVLNANPAMQQNDNMHVLISPEGVLMFKFLENFEDAPLFSMLMGTYIDTVYAQTTTIVSAKLAANKALIDSSGQLRFPTTVIYVFPKLNRDEVISSIQEPKIKDFAVEHCIFKDQMSSLRTEYKDCICSLLENSITPVSNERMIIDDLNVNSILQRIAPEYTTIRVSTVADAESKVGADNELLVITEKDVVVKAFRLDQDQINIVNKMSKGEQLILACAGSGKSVLLISKCFKAAAMNPDKQFLITCYNNNLYSLYTWFIDRAGLRAKNVTCLTFHNLCKKLLTSNGYSAAYGKFDQWATQAMYLLNNGHIRQRYYGIFIDEVQEFTTDWYKFCYNLLENKSSDDHIFVICGDKTQKLKSQQKHGKAPWNAGEGYPNYRGGNKNIRIEKNYRNCVEINEYINRYVSYAKAYLSLIEKDTELDPDMFLRGQAVNHGVGVELKKILSQSNDGEADRVLASVKDIHDRLEIPYDEIAVVMNYGHYNKHFSGWKNKTYSIENPLIVRFDREDIPYCKMYATDAEWASRYGSDGGVKMIKFDSVLGLDFRAVIVCGLITLGEYDQTKNPDWSTLKENEEEYQSVVSSTQDNIRRLYVACTRAKEVLHVIVPESAEKSVYMKMLLDALH